MNPVFDNKENFYSILKSADYLFFKFVNKIYILSKSNISWRPVEVDDKETASGLTDSGPGNALARLASFSLGHSGVTVVTRNRLEQHSDHS